MDILAKTICCILCAGVLLVGAGAQESLDAILARGYIAHWLVCGPFEPDVEGGIAAAIAAGKPALGPKDFMAPAGGIGRLRPRHLQEISEGKGKALWQQAGAESPRLDLSPFFPEQREGISYAAYYADVAKEQAVYFDLQTPLGARIWHNGFLLRENSFAPVVPGGVDRFVVRFGPGTNLVVLEIPGASLAALAAMAKIPEEEFLVRGLLNRPLLQGTSGYEIALGLKPVEQLGEVYFVPRLDTAGTFSGSVSDPRQDMFLTLFNPTPKPQPGVEISVPHLMLEQSLYVKTGPLAPESEQQARLSIPISGKEAGESVGVKVLLSTGGISGSEHAASFDASIVVTAPAEGGRVYIIAGPHFRPASPETQDALQERRNASFGKQMGIVRHDPGYGIALGPAEEWRPALTAHPDMAEDLFDAARRGRCAAHAGFGRPDERVVCGETLGRNLVYGLRMSQSLLQDHAQAFYAWDFPGIAPQTPQLLADAGLDGLISNLDMDGVSGLSRQEALDGSVAWHRRKQPSPGPGTAEELRQMASLQRRELLARGISSDILVLRHRAAPPEPFFLGAATTLARSYPAMIVQGGGGRAFLEELSALPRDTGDKLPVSARALNVGEPGSVVAQPALKRAHALVESRLLSGEKLASFAALLGADYPDAALDHAWRQLLYWSAPDRLGMAEHSSVYADALAGYREIAELVEEVTLKSAAYLAGEAGTLDAAPSDMEGAGALVVFNTCAWPRTDVCMADIVLENASGLTLYSDDGLSAPFAVERLKTSASGGLRSLRLQFVARDVPSMGYRTYYLTPRGSLPKSVEHQDAQIENEQLLLIADSKTGAITKLTDKNTGAEYARGLLNHPLLLAEDVSRADSGRAVWTAGGSRAPSGPIEMHTETSELRQRLIVTAKLGDGTVIREMTLYKGIPRVYCVLRTEGVRLDGQLLGVAFSAFVENRGPVYGERFGAVAGRFSQGTGDIRIQGRERPSGAAPYPALHWMAVSRGPYVQIGGENAVMLRPALIVHGADLTLEKTAREIQTALIRRGIPAATCPDVASKPGAGWTDGLEYSSAAGDLAYGQHFCIVVGSPEQNRFCPQVLNGLPEETLRAFNARLEQGAALLVENKNVPEGYAPAPTLVLAGLLLDRTCELGRAFAESIRARGVYSLPPALCSVDAPRIPGDGLAVLFPGVFLGNMDRDGTLFVGLAHGSGPAAGSEVPGLPGEDAPQFFEYALAPFSGDWRESGIAAAGEGYAERLLAVQTGLHAGRQPGTQCFLSFDKPGLIVSAVKPVGNPFAEGRVSPSEPRNGLVLRVHETTGTAWEGSLQAFVPMSSLRTADLLENPRASLASSERTARLQVPGFGVETLLLTLSSRFEHGEAAMLARNADPYGPVATRYWRCETGGEPFGGQPLSLLLLGELADGESTIKAVIRNQMADESVEGMVLLKAAEGWSIGPAQFYYRLGPGETLSQDVLVLNATGDGDTGGIAAWTEYGGQVYRDVVERQAAPLTLTVSRTESQVKAVIENRSGIAAEGFAEIIVPPAYWPELPEFNAEADATVFPRRAAVSVAPFKTQEILFRFSDPAAHPWGLIKIGANGHVLRHPLPGNRSVE